MMDKLPDARVFPFSANTHIVDGRHGFYVINPHDTYIGKSLALYGEYSEIEWQVMSRFVRPSTCAVEIGANIGSISLPIAKLLGAHGLLVCYEPQPEMHWTLAATMRLNGLRNIELRNAGVSKDAFHLSIPQIDYDRPFNAGGVSFANRAAFPSEGGTSISFAPLEEQFTRRALHFLKVDVEKMELEVLKGAQSIIEKFRPIMWIENDDPELSSNLTSAISDMGYRMYWAITPLFNAENYFAHGENFFPNISAFNMVCIPDETDDAPVSDLSLVEPQAPHPLLKRPI